MAQMNTHNTNGQSTRNTGTQSAAQQQSGNQTRNTESGTIPQEGRKQTGTTREDERSFGDSNDGDFDTQSTRPTGETPSTNRGFSQVDRAAQNEMSQRVAADSENTDNEDQFLTDDETGRVGSADGDDLDTDTDRRSLSSRDDEFNQTPHRKDPSSMNQVNQSQQDTQNPQTQRPGTERGFPPDDQMSNKTTSNRH